jgi:hypothetical protein
MGKHRKNENYLTNKELEIETLKGIRSHIKSELSKMAVLAVKLSKTNDLPLEWRKKEDETLLQFIIKNKDVKIELIYKKL